MGPPVEKDGGEETLWAEKWNQTVWGNQLELDDMERQAYHTARQKATAGGDWDRVRPRPQALVTGPFAPVLFFTIPL